MEFSAIGAPRLEAQCRSDADCNSDETCWALFCYSHYFTPDDILSIGLTPITKNVKLDFIVLDNSGPLVREEGDKPSLLKCDGKNLFESVDIDLATAEITIDRAKTYTFADCGMRPSAATLLARFQTVAVPVGTTDGKDFAGTYEFQHT